MEQIRNPNFEIRNKIEIQNNKHIHFRFRNSNLFRISDFEIRILQRHAAQGGDFFTGTQLLQSVDGGLDEVDGVGAAVNLGQDVVDAGGNQNVAHARARLDAGAGA